MADNNKKMDNSRLKNARKKLREKLKTKAG